MSKDLLVIVPTRGRPHNAARMMNAWVTTGAYEDANLTFAVDHDDPEMLRYQHLSEGPASFQWHGHWTPMVHKLNRGVMAFDSYPYVAFMGDDHIPRTDGWAARYCEELAEMGTGIVFGNDLIQGRKLCTQWAMTTDIVKALGRMVPAPVEHMYCDNSVMDLGLALDRIRYLPDVRIEHAHPVAGRGAWDAGYERVNSREQYRKDHASYQAWKAEQLPRDVETVRDLMKEKAS